MGSGAAETAFGQIVGDRICALRTGLGWTQAELARRAGKHATDLATIEAGRARLSVEALVDVAFALGVDPSELVAGLLPRGRRRWPRPAPPVRAG